ncbi:MAG: lipoyl(octanoyl) transferase, partial [Flammeovirgaceae bacterium]
DLDYFQNIVPCGIADKAVTSLEKELGEPQNIQEVEQKLLKHFANLFGMELENVEA